ncbi:myo-inositol-1(or 4)-monophosphatase [Anaerobacterium chartisolvens]|uniref:Myo-inositol-1(Or 4)-monophosphatase n=1 Tax=Anaerobacterium chartisolvens TaxID=1297424 RepID=A0A369AI70_9FIRM|nr:inositol monophosphatase family protein [Anaerobacterium chartisolvens]RCX09079.1 myo-inositol-1(or 4)-monophosphatase [Anaerobacterium chartisolvens]
MKEYILNLADYVFRRISNKSGMLKNRSVRGYSDAGDAQFNIDDMAEEAVMEYAASRSLAMAIYTEDGGMKIIGEDPQYVLIVDPIDGTRPAAADLEMSCISIAAAPFSQDARIKDVRFAVLKELKSGAYMYADYRHDRIFHYGYRASIPNLSLNTSMRNMFWSIEFNGHPAGLMTQAYGNIIDYTANNGGVFIFNSASFSISRIITGQLDAHVDIGNRILKDNPSLMPAFQSVGNGKILHLFPYDIAASVFLAEKAGVVITDAYGNSLGDTLLLDLTYHNQQSCIAASTRELHQELINNINWSGIQML